MADSQTLYAVAVEDDEGSALLLQAILRRMGISTSIHSTGEHFLQYIRELPTCPDMVLMDINLPRQSGIEIAKELRNDPQFANTIIIAISAVDTNTYIPKVKEAGFNAFLRKPINRINFVKQIERILDGEAIWETH